MHVFAPCAHAFSGVRAAEGRYWSTSQRQGVIRPPTQVAPGGHVPPQNSEKPLHV
jgi:hypothetical protein